MAHSLKLRVIAEGVETDDQLDYLRHSDCDEIQGFLFSQPLTAADMATLVSSGRGLAAAIAEPAAQADRPQQPLTT
jgi:EAL domain-containing protein (putative c-di-GMP-specific phosphodiesterase class I)